MCWLQKFEKLLQPLQISLYLGLSVLFTQTNLELLTQQANHVQYLISTSIVKCRSDLIGEKKRTTRIIDCAGGLRQAVGGPSHPAFVCRKDHNAEVSCVVNSPAQLHGAINRAPLIEGDYQIRRAVSSQT